MASGFFDSVALSNHNHSTTPGDGGQLSNLSVSGTVGASGNISSSGGVLNEASAAALATDVPQFSQMTVWAAALGS